MNIKCFSCGNLFDLPDGPVGRGETCPKCVNDVRVCLNCKHFDPNTYNECAEPMAERVVDKSKSNFCDYFSPTSDTSGRSSGPSREDSLKKLDDLFKK